MKKDMKEELITELEVLILKMKCGGNCKHEYWINTGAVTTKNVGLQVWIVLIVKINGR